MKSCLFATGLLMLLWGAQAQQPASLPADDNSAQRARIAADRSSAQALFEKDEVGCYQRFAVTDCLREVKVRRRAVLEALRREELVLNDADRKKRAEEHARRASEKSAAVSTPDAADHGVADGRELAKRQRTAGQRKAGPVGIERRREPSADLPVTAPGATSAARRAQDRQAFEEKQLKAQQRKALRDKALEERLSKPDRHLPLPP